jgi:hypothetical protein
LVKPRASHRRRCRRIFSSLQHIDNDTDIDIDIDTDSDSDNRQPRRHARSRHTINTRGYVHTQLRVPHHVGQSASLAIAVEALDAERHALLADDAAHAPAAEYRWHDARDELARIPTLQHEAPPPATGGRTRRGQLNNSRCDTDTNDDDGKDDKDGNDDGAPSTTTTVDSHADSGTGEPLTA